MMNIMKFKSRLADSATGATSALGLKEGAPYLLHPNDVRGSLKALLLGSRKWLGICFFPLRLI